MSQADDAMTSTQDVENAVRERYAQGASERVPELCCPVEYDAKYLEVIPQEVIERDYGCGDPSQHLRAGERVLDLGSGTGKICFIASQVVGAEGSVVGVDMTDDMLDVARRHAPTVAERIGYGNVEFKKGKIQDLALDVQRFDRWLADHPVKSWEDHQRAADELARLRSEEPLIEDASVDVVVSNCVLNLVRPEDKGQLFEELMRVLKPGGRAVISDIVSDELVPDELQADPTLWSGCISGAYREDSFLAAFEEVGFHGARILVRDDKPWAVVEGIEFRSLTVEAFKPLPGRQLDRKHAVIYRGPWKEVVDDRGQVYRRGERTAVGDLSYQHLTAEPYSDAVIGVEPYEDVPADRAVEFFANGHRVRQPRESKGENYRVNQDGDDCCSPSTGCC